MSCQLFRSTKYILGKYMYTPINFCRPSYDYSIVPKGIGTPFWVPQVSGPNVRCDELLRDSAAWHGALAPSLASCQRR